MSILQAGRTLVATNSYDNFALQLNGLWRYPTNRNQDLIAREMVVLYFPKISKTTLPKKSFWARSGTPGLPSGPQRPPRHQSGSQVGGKTGPTAGPALEAWKPVLDTSQAFRDHPGVTQKLFRRAAGRGGPLPSPPQPLPGPGC